VRSGVGIVLFVVPFLPLTAGARAVSEPAPGPLELVEAYDTRACGGRGRSRAGGTGMCRPFGPRARGGDACSVHGSTVCADTTGVRATRGWRECFDCAEEGARPARRASGSAHPLPPSSLPSLPSLLPSFFSSSPTNPSSLFQIIAPALGMLGYKYVHI
jgi:hypothetical protein